MMSVWCLVAAVLLGLTEAQDFTLSRLSNPDGTAPTCLRPMEIGQFSKVCDEDRVTQLRQLAAEPAGVSCGFEAILDALQQNRDVDETDYCHCVREVGYSAMKHFRCKLHPDGSDSVSGLAGLCTFENICNWFVPGVPPSEGTPARGIISENLYDSNVINEDDGCDYSLDPANGVDGLARYTCDANFCPNCDEVGQEGRQYAGYCDASCHYCQRWDNVFPGSNCPYSLLGTWSLLLQKCYNQTTEKVSCGIVELVPPCFQEDGQPCYDRGSPISNLPCEAGIARTGQRFCTTPLTSVGLPGTFGDYCQLSCYMLTTPPQEFDCSALVRQGQNALLEDCYQQDDLMAAVGFAPYIDCTRDMASSCIELDCTNLYYDVIDSCDLDGADCSSSACAQARRLFENHASTCVGPKRLGNRGISLAQFTDIVNAKCQGCYMTTDIITDCASVTRASSQCPDACADAVKIFNSTCYGVLDNMGLHDEVSRMRLINSACNKSCIGLRPPYRALPGTCSNTLLSGQTCSFQCRDQSLVPSGVQPVCHSGRIVYDNDNSFRCDCANGTWWDVIFHRCIDCTPSCAPPSFQNQSCGYDREGLYTQENDLVCKDCEEGEYYDADKCAGQGPRCIPCSPCTVCSGIGAVEVIQCKLMSDAVCGTRGTPCSGVVAPINGHLGSCPETMQDLQTCELQCNAGEIDEWHHQPKCVGGVLLNNDPRCEEASSERWIECTRWSRVHCGACADGIDDVFLESAGNLGILLSSRGVRSCSDTDSHGLIFFLQRSLGLTKNQACTTDFASDADRVPGLLPVNEALYFEGKRGVIFYYREKIYGNTVASICSATCGVENEGCQDQTHTSGPSPPPPPEPTSEDSIRSCDEDPCENGGVCVVISADGDSTCDCQDGWTGPTCGVSAGVCGTGFAPSVTCCPQPAAQCIQDTPFSSHCEIRGGFRDNSDGTCEDINECESNPCENGGDCNDRRSHYTCTCPEGFLGINCEQDCQHRTGGADGCHFVDCPHWLATLSHSLNEICCSSTTCEGVPTQCSETCAAAWTPFM